MAVCNLVMLDTMGPELQVVNKSQTPISLQADGSVILTPDQEQEATSEVLPINFDGLAKAVKKGDTIFIGQYLFTGSETTSVWLEVSEVKGDDVVCAIKNTATLAGSLFTLHISQVHIDLPTLSEQDKQVISTWGVKNKIDFLSLSYTRHAEDVRQAREFLSKLGDLKQTQIFAKIENVEGLTHFDEILQAADGIILSRGNLGIDLPPEKVFLFQKSALYKCNMAGKPAVVTRVVDSMTDNLRPTRAEATDVANAVLDGSDAILLGAETLRGLYPVETISTVGKICSEAEKVFNQDLYFKKTVKYVGEPMSHLESIASSAVRAAIKVKASIIICFTSSGRAARLIAKYRPTMPVLSVVIPRLKTNQLKWIFSGAFEARQSLVVRGLFPILADPRHPEVWVDRMSGKVCMAVSAQGLAINGIDDRRYWNLVPTEESRFNVVAYLQQIWWFEVEGLVNFPLPPDTYTLSFRLHLGRFSKRLGRRVCNYEHTHGWDIKPVRFDLSTSEGQQASSECFLDDTEQDDVNGNHKRGCWIDYTVGEFVVSGSEPTTEVRFSMKQIDCTHSKGGLCVDSVFIIPSDLKEWKRRGP